MSEFKSEVEDIFKRINNASNYALSEIDAQTIPLLSKHIQQDVYDAYPSPKAYRRNPSTGLADVKGAVFASYSDQRMEWTYLPDGTNEMTFQQAGVDSKKFGRKPEDVMKEHPVHGDSLIRRIDKGVGYDWFNPGPRPFYENFVKELIDDGVAINAFVNGLNAADADLEAKNVGQEIYREPADYDI